MAASSMAQTAPDFPFTPVEKNLAVSYLDSQKSVQPAGIQLLQDETMNPPTVYPPSDEPNDYPAAGNNSTYVLFMIDQDTRSQTGAPSPFLHWFRPNLVVTPYALAYDPLLNVALYGFEKINFGADYIPPSPPPDMPPHRYTFVLFEQPEGWVVPEKYTSVNPPTEITARIGFDLSEFVRESGLGEPVGANWVQVTGKAKMT